MLSKGLRQEIHYVPAPLQDLASPYEKGQMALAGIISKIVRPRSDKFKVWEHIQGQILTRCKLDYHYYGMYGFMVTNHETSAQDNTNASSVTEVQIRIKTALLWLRSNNHLYQSFHANYDTLYRYDPDKVLHLHNASDYPTQYNKTVESQLKDEASGIVTNLDDCGINATLTDETDQAGVQHPITVK